jgi:hypothetical protein
MGGGTIMGKKKKKKERITLWYASDLNLWKESDNQTGISFIKIKKTP